MRINTLIYTYTLRQIHVYNKEETAQVVEPVCLIYTCIYLAFD